MLYTVANTAGIGKPVDRIVDATGRVFDRGLLEADTETGRIIRHVFNENGSLCINEAGEIVIEIIRVVSPLKVFFKSLESGEDQQ